MFPLSNLWDDGIKYPNWRKEGSQMESKSYTTYVPYKKLWASLLTLLIFISLPHLSSLGIL